MVVEDDRCLGMGIPLNHLIDGHFHWRLGGTVAIETINQNEDMKSVQSAYTCLIPRGRPGTHLCISDADLVIPLHNKINIPAMVIDTKKRVLVTSTRIALHGGNLALADFHVTPPLGRSIFPLSLLLLLLYCPTSFNQREEDNKEIQFNDAQ